MTRTPRTVRALRGGVAAAGLALVVAPLGLPSPSVANTTGTDLVISEVYGGGGNSGATLKQDFIELYNPTSTAKPLSGWSIQYRAATSSGDPSSVVALQGSVPAKGRFLLGAAKGTGGTTDLPTPDQQSDIAISGSGGQVLLARTTAKVSPGTGNVSDPDVADFLGWGSNAVSFEKAAAGGTANTTSVSRSAVGADTDSNKDDFLVGAPTPAGTGGGTTEPPAPTGPVAATIAQIQGTGSRTPYDGQQVVTRGVVTAAYPTGGFAGFAIQTPGTGGAIDLTTHKASDGLFAYLGNGAPASAYPAVGDHVEVTGKATEFNGLTEVNATKVEELAEPAAAPQPATLTWPGDDAQRESLESMLLAPQGPMTVSDNFTTNRYAEIGLARGTEPLPQPTDVARPGTPEIRAIEADNAARKLVLDDGASIDFLPFNGGPNQDVPLPYLSPQTPIRVGAAATFTRPVLVDYRNNAWKVQPTSQLTADNDAAVRPATFENTRTDAPEAVGGNVKVASFNVLNYFTETGTDWIADGGTCDFYVDRDDDPVTDDDCGPVGPRGAAEDEDLARQQAKIVTAINALDADVLSLEEIENSAKYAGPDHRDDALATLVDALNADRGSKVWAFVPSPPASERPAIEDEDVIRTAFIYQRKVVRPLGGSRILQDEVNFDNAREPLAQHFVPLGSPTDDFVAIVNHFKSKSSGVDTGDGQGASNADRVGQAKALVAFADEVSRDAGTDRVLLTGDFNAYTQEDPMQVLYRAGYADLGAEQTDEATYLFGGVVGSLDHVLASPAMDREVTGADVWQINSVESVAFEYSRHNYNATDFYAPNAFRASDHDPLLVGLALGRPRHPNG